MWSVERDDIVLAHLLQLAASEEASSQTRAEALFAVGELEGWVKAQTKGVSRPELQAHWNAGLDTIARFRKDPAKFSAPPALATPPGQPIGEDGDEFTVR